MKIYLLRKVKEIIIKIINKKNMKNMQAVVKNSLNYIMKLKIQIQKFKQLQLIYKKLLMKMINEQYYFFIE